jgi:FkbH-like protein
MIETLPTRTEAARLAIDPDALRRFAAFAGELAARSQVVWGEHCSECAYPTCYETCAFYTPRPDLHCRRFEGGIEPIADVPTTLRLHRIRFRRWGKLEAIGGAAIVSAADAGRRDRRNDRLSDAIHAVPAPFAVKRRIAARWNRHKERRSGRPGAARPDAFVVEAWAADGRHHALTLTLLNTGPGNGRLFQTRFEAGPAYRRLTVPINEIEHRVDLGAPFLIQIEPIGEAAGRDVVFGVCDFVRFLPMVATGSPATPGDASDMRTAKVVVWDLDETVWMGTLAEDGARGVTLKPEAAAAIRALDERGVLQSIASKNDRDEAMAALTTLGLDGYFLHPQIGWGPKSQSIARIADALGLGLDSFVFIDDQAFERAEVTARHPAVRALAHTAVAGLTTHAWFDLPVTPESRRRRGLYLAEAARDAAFQTAGDDYPSFLRDAGITVTIRDLVAGDAERVHELSQRTNQLNFQGTKVTREDVQAMLAPPSGRHYLTIRCTDRFGDYGLIGFVSIDLERGEITDLFMSCRVQRKRVEHAVFAWIATQIGAAGLSRLGVRHRPTGRNAAARAMLEELGFDPPAQPGTPWSRHTALPFADADIVRVIAQPRLVDA